MSVLSSCCGKYEFVQKVKIVLALYILFLCVCVCDVCALFVLFFAAVTNYHSVMVYNMNILSYSSKGPMSEMGFIGI